jgi:peptidoglycan hydrolase-like amidase
MRLRSLGVAAVTAAALMQSCQPACTPTPAPPPVTTTPPPTPPPPPPPPTSLTVAGQGNGHGRGLSAWGAYGMAVNAGATWEQIVAKYYGGTLPKHDAPNRTIGVRLLWADDLLTTTVISTGADAVWKGVTYGSLQAAWVSPNTYDIYGAPSAVCGADPGWRLIERVIGPVTFATSVDQTTASPGDVLGLCRPDGTVTHYRGAIRAVTDGTGRNHAVNDLLIENYLRGVLSREVPSSWGDAAGGMNALSAMAVAARSFALSQNRYPDYAAQTCDTAACQVYGGAAFRRSPDSPTSYPTATQVCETGNPTFECRNTTRALTATAGSARVWSDGRYISGEYSATHGPYSAGVSFPVVDDSVSAVAGNPLYTWRRTVAAADIVRSYPQIGTFTGAWTERDPASTANGVWGNRIVLQGTAGTVVVGNLAFRNTFGFPSHGFSVASVG